MHKHHMKTTLTLLVAIVWSLSFENATAATASAGCATVKKLTDLFSSWSGKPDAKVFAQAAHYIDYSTMAERALGKEQWSKLKPSEKNSFTQTLRKLMEKRYYVRWHKIFSSSKVNCLDQSSNNGDTLVTTDLVRKEKSDTVGWLLNGKNSKIISLSVGDKDLLKRLSVKLNKRLKRSGFDGVLAWMEKAASAKSSTEEPSEEASSITGEPD